MSHAYEMLDSTPQLQHWRVIQDGGDDPKTIDVTVNMVMLVRKAKNRALHNRSGKAVLAGGDVHAKVV